MPDFEDLREVLQYVRIAHHIRGRIRLKFEMPGLNAETAKGWAVMFQTLLGRVPGVDEVQFNMLARSCTVRYVPATISMQAWQDALEGRQSAEARVLADALRSVWQEVTRAQS